MATVELSVPSAKPETGWHRAVSLAHHEAGHAVVAWHLGRRFMSVTLDPAHGSSGRVRFTEPLVRQKGDPKAADAILIYLAGPMAGWPFERRFRAASSIDDLTRAERLCLQVSADSAAARELFAVCKERAWNLLARADLSAALSTVADALLRRGKLNGAVVRDLIAGAVEEVRVSARLRGNPVV